jgi:Tfp pilus assembly protein PilP
MDAGRAEQYSATSYADSRTDQVLPTKLHGRKSDRAFQQRKVGECHEREFGRNGKQPLEAYPLDTMRMVGSLTKDGQLVALLKVDSLLYQVRAGSYLGQNYGRITKISETEITLREIAQDAAGEWAERPAALQLQEDASK